MQMFKVLSIRDAKAENFNQPFFAMTTAVGLRMVEQAANDKEHDFNRFCTDYVLYELGEFNSGTGELYVHQQPVHVADVAALVKHQAQLQEVG